MKRLKRIVLVLAAITVGTVASAQGLWNWQKWGHDRRRANESPYSVRVGISGAPVMMGERFTDGSAFGSLDKYYEDLYIPMYPSVDNAYKDYIGNVYSTGAITGEFEWNAGRLFNLSANAGFCPIWTRIFDGVTDERKGGRFGCAIFIMPEIRLMYCNTPKVRAYSSLGLGLGMYPGFSEADFINGEVQLNLAGVEVGRKWFGFGEFGVGTMFTGFRVGAGYRFVNKSRRK